MDITSNLPEQEPTTTHRILNGFKDAARFAKSILYLTKKVFML